jgi:hypothetical protein
MGGDTVNEFEHGTDNSTWVIMVTYFELRKAMDEPIKPGPGLQQQYRRLHEHLARLGYDVNDIYQDYLDHYPIPLKNPELDAWAIAMNRTDPYVVKSNPETVQLLHEEALKNVRRIQGVRDD